MWIALLVVAVVAVVLILLVRVILIGRRPTHGPQPEVTDPAAAADEFPAPGEPSPHYPDGSPVPGSRDDRRRKGAE